MPTMRLDRFFSSQELLSRKEVKPYIKQGRIKVNGTAASRPDQSVNTHVDTVSLDNLPIEYKPFVYIMLNKPQGYVSSTDDKINPTVLTLVPKPLFRSDLFPAGRLDKDSTGFVLLTNDGEMAHRILSPKNHVSKLYHVRLDHPLEEDARTLIEAGIKLADGYVCMPCKVCVLESSDNPLVSVLLCEGKYHQIKRMFGVVGCGVLSLKRVQIGGMKLDPLLDEGGCKEILHKDIISSLLDFPSDFI